jgi:hypothetical protein
MATAAELLEEMRAQGQGTPESEQIQSRKEEGTLTAPAPPHVNGVPLDQHVANEQALAPSEIDPVAAVTADHARQVRASKNAMSLLEIMRQQSGASDISLFDSPSVTTRSTYRAPVTDEFQDPLGSGNVIPDELPPPDPDSMEGFKRMRKEQGVRFDRGLPFLQRLRQAQSAPIPRGKAIIMGQLSATMPDDVQIQWDPVLEQWYWPLQIDEADVRAGRERKEDIGQYRYVALDEDDFTFADFADMADVSEILALGFSLAGVGKFDKMIGIPGRGLKANVIGGAKEAGGQAGLGTVGRLTGDAYRVLFDILATGGAFQPTREELFEMGLDDAGIELFAAVGGEILGRTLNGGAVIAQDFMARITGREGVLGGVEEVAAAQENRVKSRRDMKRIQDADGGTDFTMTRGEATGSIDEIERENALLRGTSPATRMAEDKRQAKSRLAAARATDEWLKLGDPTLGYGGVVARANEAFANEGIIVTKIDTTQGAASPRITFSLKSDTEQGLRVMPFGRSGEMGDAWQVVGTKLDPELRNTGLVDELYLSAAREARAHHKRLVSDSEMTPAAIKVWERLQREQPEFAGIKRNTKAEWIEGEQRWKTPDGSPIFEMVERDPLIPKLLDSEFSRSRINTKGEITEHSVLSGVFRGQVGRNTMAHLRDEITNNAFLRHELQKEFLNDYRLYAFDLKTGQIDPKKFMKWKSETGRFADELFSPEDALRIKRPGGLDEIVAKEAQRMANLETSLRNVFKLPKDYNLKDPGAVSQGLWKQWTKMSIQDRRMAAAMLERGGMIDEMRSFLFNDIRMIFKRSMLAKGGGLSAAEGIVDQINRFDGLIRDIFPKDPRMAQQYIGNLRTLARQLQRKALKGELKGFRPEANPNMLAMTRVMFGPLSRAQRFLTAARRIQLRRMGEHSIDIVSNPDQIRDLVRLRNLPIESRQAGQVLTRLGIGEWFLDDEGSPQDMNDPEVRREFMDFLADVELAQQKASE